MAPLTRRRATDDHIPTDIMIEYYKQRASAGLIIAEATNISPQGTGYMNSPGIYNAKQVNAWSKITESVHKENGRIFLQLWHVGRISHSLNIPGNKKPVSASPISASGDISTQEGNKPMPVPKELDKNGIINTIRDYKIAAKNAIEAGFDGVEIHAANGYLIDQFIQDGSNNRNDEYGGNINNRIRLAVEVTDTVCDAIGPEKVGIRLSPSGINKDMFDSTPVETFTELVSKMNKYDLAYLHLLEPLVPLKPPEKYNNYLPVVTPYFRKVYNGTLITNAGYSFESGNSIISEGNADLVAFGKLYISNPDLVERFRAGKELNKWDTMTFYHGGTKGYIDYPLLNISH